MSRASDVRRVGAASSSASTLSAALERESGRSRVTIGLGSCGIAAGARSVFDVLSDELAGTADIVSVGCRGLCFAEPLVGVAWPDGRTALYGNVDAAAAARIAEGVRVGEIELEALSDDVIAGQERRVLDLSGVIDPASIDEYRAVGGYRALERALAMSPDDVIGMVDAAGLRGRGGAGYPTGAKWRACADAVEARRAQGGEAYSYLVMNGDEGDPGAYMNRGLLESDPHKVVEGLVIAAYAVRARAAYLFIRAEYPLACATMKHAIEQAREAGFVGEDILGSGYSLEASVVRGAVAYLSGEETALIRVLEDGACLPRKRPPYPAQEGLWSMPTCVNNVETLANVPFIVVSGPYIGQFMPGGALAIWGVDSYEPHDLADTYQFGRPLTMDAATFDGGTEAMTLFDTKAIVLWGFDVYLNYPEFAYYFNLARDKGIPLIYIDPRYTWTAHLADQWIPIRPSTDAAMLEAMAYVIFTEGLENKEFIEKNVEPVGFERWRQVVLGEYDDQPKTPEWDEKICGVPAETIAALARLCADGPVYMRMVWAATRILGGEDPARLDNYLRILTGNLGINGCIGTGMDFGVKKHFPVPNMNFYGERFDKIEEHCVIEGEIWHRAILEHKRYEDGEISLAEYKRIVGCPQKETAPNIKMIWQTVNPRNMIPNYYDSSARMKAVMMTPFVAYSAYTWATTMTWYSDLVLPLAHQFFEGGGGDNFVLQGYSFNTAFSPAAGNYFIGMGKVIDPPGECRTRLWILKEVAERIKIPGDPDGACVADYYCPDIKGVKWEDLDGVLEEMAHKNFDEWREMDEIKPLDPPTWEEFKKVPYFIRPIEDDYWVCLKSERNGEAPYQTESGKIELIPSFLENHDYHNVAYKTKCLGKGYIETIPHYRDVETSPLSPQVNQYPLYMITPHAFYCQHFCQDENPWFRDEYRMDVWISAADAAKRGIKDGELVLAHNGVGQCLVPAYVTSRLTPGIACMIFGRNYDPSHLKTEIMPEGIDRAGSCNFLIPSEDYDHRRGILMCASMIDITNVEGKGFAIDCEGVE